MAKLKSIKCYNFGKLSGTTYMTFNMKFYDSSNNLIIINIPPSELITCSSTLCENADYKITAHGTTHATPNGAFHTGNYNNTLGLQYTGYPTWSFEATDSWIKIEFKIPKNMSDIKICHSIYGPSYGFDTCSYDIEYSDNSTESGYYRSNGHFSPIDWRDCYNGRYEQSVMDAQFHSIDFSKSKLIYDTKIGYIETLDTNNFRNIPINTVEWLKSLCVKPNESYLNCLISFDKKQTGKSFDGTNWNTISDISPENIILNGMEVNNIDRLDKKKLISGGFGGNLDFKIAMKTNDKTITPSVTKIYIEYK